MLRIACLTLEARGLHSGFEEHLQALQRCCEHWRAKRRSHLAHTYTSSWPVVSKANSLPKGNLWATHGLQVCTDESVVTLVHLQGPSG